MLDDVLDDVVLPGEPPVFVVVVVVVATLVVLTVDWDVELVGFPLEQATTKQFAGA